MSTVKSRGMLSPRARQGMVRRIQLMRPPALMPGQMSSPITCPCIDQALSCVSTC
jgi:hypothetical protein